MEISLARLAVITLDPAPKSWNGFSVSNGTVEVQDLGHFRENGRLGLVVAAVIPLETSPLRTAQGELVLPSKARQAAERMIDLTANLLAVSERCRCSISSHIPPVALVPMDEDARHWLSTVTGLQTPLRAFPIPNPMDGLDVDLIARLVQDRLDGLQLLAEALSHHHATGKFHEFLRLFERAFGRASSQLVQPLADFLQAHPRFGYTEEEVRQWLVMLRHPATHADTREEFLLEADVRPFIPRMQQAAYDVLLNKTKWRSTSTARRQEWQPSSGSRSKSGSAFIEKGSPTSILEATLLDPFAVYPLFLKGSIMLPTDWWTISGDLSSLNWDIEVVDPGDKS